MCTVFLFCCRPHLAQSSGAGDALGVATGVALTDGSVVSSSSHVVLRAISPTPNTAYNSATHRAPNSASVALSTR